MPSTAEITQVGKRESLADIIFVADAKNTPFTSMVKKGKSLTNMYHEWQADAYASPQTAGVLDGEDVATFEDAAANRARFGVYAQELRRSPKVNQLAEDVSTVAGINSPDPQGVRGDKEFARAKAKKLVEIKRDIETLLLSDTETRQESGGDAYQTRGLGRWIQNDAQAVQPVPAAFRTPATSVYSSALASFDEEDLRALLQSRWEQTGATDELKLICGPGIKNAITDFGRYVTDKSGFLQIRRGQNAEPSKIESAVDFYNGDYGTVEVHLSSFLPNAQRGYLLDMRGIELCTKGEPSYRDLPDLGGGPRGLIRAIVALCVGNPLAHGKIAATL
jgi:hypothetical protein